VRGWTPQFGERVLNKLASPHNPNRIGIFVKVVLVPAGRMNAGRWWELTDGKGEFWEVRPDGCEPALIDGTGATE
jgi:hypothetical protein